MSALPDYARQWIIGAPNDPNDGAEGGLVNDPNDPGGLTKFGISRKAYPNVDIEHLTEDDAAALYARDYWTVADCDQLPAPVALAVFDAAVNQGPDTAKRLLQLAVGARADGVIGPATLGAVFAAAPAAVVERFLERRWDRYRSSQHAGSSLRGWTFRLLRLAAACAVVHA